MMKKITSSIFLLLVLIGCTTTPIKNEYRENVSTSIDNKIKAKELIINGKQNFEKKLYKDSILDFEEANRLNPNSFDELSYEFLVRSYRELELFDEAIVILNEGIQKYPNYKEYYFLGGDILTFNYGKNYEKAKLAIQYYKNYIKFFENDETIENIYYFSHIALAYMFISENEFAYQNLKRFYILAKERNDLKAVEGALESLRNRLGKNSFDD